MLARVMFLLAACLMALTSLPAFAQSSELEPPAGVVPEAVPDVDALSGPMTGARLGELIALIDPMHEAMGNAYLFTVADWSVQVVYDEAASRMRVITAIAPSSVLSDELAVRMLQANFDAVLDARYAIANDVIWAAFIHPLGSLTDDDFISAVAQVVTAADTFGTTFSSGAMMFGGGDSNELHEQLVEELRGALEGDGI